jgi:PIN domain nuclease of toxin-antitoxin system
LNLLLDTHVLAWWVLNSPMLTERAREAIANPGNRIFVSAITPFEMSTKHRIGKWPDIGEFLERFDENIRIERFEHLPVLASHSILAGAFPVEHRDPFDRMLAAQSIIEGMPLITSDPAFAFFDMRTLF